MTTVFEVGAFKQAAELQDVLGTGLAPEHARLFEPPPEDFLASGFDHAAAYEVTLLAKIAVTSALDVGGEVGDLAAHDFLVRLIKVWIGC